MGRSELNLEGSIQRYVFHLVIMLKDYVCRLEPGLKHVEVSGKKSGCAYFLYNWAMELNPRSSDSKESGNEAGVCSPHVWLEFYAGTNVCSGHCGSRQNG